MCRKWVRERFSRFEAEIEALKVAKNHFLFDFASHPGQVAFAPDSRLVAYGCDDATVFLFQLDAGPA